jgi:hypothetical protein
MANANASAINIDQAISGMALSEAIRDHNGDVLLLGGAVLTDAAIASLRRRGVARISVVGEAISAAMLEASREQMQARLNQLFRLNNEHEPNRTLSKCIARYRTE